MLEFFHYKGKVFLFPIPFSLRINHSFIPLYLPQVVTWDLQGFPPWARTFFILSILHQAHVFSWMSVNLPGKELSTASASINPVVSFSNLGYCWGHVIMLVWVKAPENACHSAISLSCLRPYHETVDLGGFVLIGRKERSFDFFL